MDFLFVLTTLIRWFYIYNLITRAIYRYKTFHGKNLASTFVRTNPTRNLRVEKLAEELRLTGQNCYRTGQVLVLKMFSNGATIQELGFLSLFEYNSVCKK